MILAAISMITAPAIASEGHYAAGSASQPGTWVMLVLALILIAMSSRRVVVARSRRKPG